MKVECVLGSGLSEDLREMVDRRVAFKLARFTGVVRIAHVSVRDQNGPKGGVDIRCKVALKLIRGGELVVEHDAASVGEALEFALTRAVRSLTKTIEIQSDRSTRGNSLASMNATSPE